MESKMNGSDKNVACVEENIEGLKRLFYANALTQYGKRKLIDYYEQQIKELEEKWDKDTHKLQNALDLANADKINNYTPNSKIKEKIEEFKLKIEKYYEHKIQGKETDVEFYENITNIEIVRVLQELLEGK